MKKNIEVTKCWDVWRNKVRKEEEYIRKGVVENCSKRNLKKLVNETGRILKMKSFVKMHKEEVKFREIQDNRRYKRKKMKTKINIEKRSVTYMMNCKDRDMKYTGEENAL